MKDYNHIPRPLIEEHYHIRHLIESQEKRTADRNYHRDKLKEQEEREKVLSDSKIVAITDFWCNRCKEDFKAQAIRQIENDWSCNTQRIAFYKTKCSKGHWCIRHITDKHLDQFLFKSKLLALDRKNHSLDVLQPHQIGYNTLYGFKQ
jgi:hypothetical protein